MDACCCLSRAQRFATPWIRARQVPQSMEFSRREYWSRLPFLSPGDIQDSGIESGSPALGVDSLSSEPPRKPLEVIVSYCVGNCVVTLISGAIPDAVSLVEKISTYPGT